MLRLVFIKYKIFDFKDFISPLEQDLIQIPTNFKSKKGCDCKWAHDHYL